MRARATVQFVLNFLFTAVLIATSASAANLLTNGTFDTNVASWAPQSGQVALSWSALDAAGSGTSGSAVVQNNLTSRGSAAAGAFQCVTVAGGTPYVFSGSVNIPNGQGKKGKAALSLRWYSGAGCSGTLLASNSATVNTRGVWTPATLNATSPAAAVSVAAYMNVQKPGGNSSGFYANFDNLSLAGLPGALQFSAATYSVSEADPLHHATITVSRVGGTNGAVTVNYTTGGGTATAGGDYTTVFGTLSFADGQSSRTFDVPVTDDALLEPDETVGLTLSSPTGGATLGAPATATLTIVDDDSLNPGSLLFSATDYQLSEGGGNVTLTVTRSGGSFGAATVNYTTQDGSAVQPADYTATTGALTFLNGEVSKSFTVPIIDDTVIEPSEVFSVTLSNVTGAQLASPSAATVTILDDDVLPAVLDFSSPLYSVSEGGAAATVTVNRTAGMTGDVTIDYATSDGSATAGLDYTATSGSLTILENDTAGDFVIPILEDAFIEGDESVNLTLTNPTGGATLGTTSAAQLTIVDNDVAQPGTLALSSATYSYAEGAGVATITVLRSGGSSGPVSVAYATSDGTATAGSDYTTTTGTLNFSNGQVSNSFDVPILEDSAVEGNETVNVTLSNVKNATLGTPSAATLTIVDNDVAPVGQVQFSSSSYTVGESGGIATIVVNRINGSAGAVTIDYHTSNATATAGSDYTTATGTLSFADGETTKSFDVPILVDNIVEGDETVGLLLSNPTGGVGLTSPSAATLTIVDDDLALPGTLHFSQSAYAVSESAGIVTITVTRSGGSSGTVTAGYSTTAGTATADTDYTTQSGTLTFAAGVLTQTFDVPIAADAAIEGDETFTVTLQNATGGASIGSPSSAVVTIVDDDSSVDFAQPTFYVGETGGTAILTLSRTGATSATNTVAFTTASGSATSGSDFTAASGTVTFDPGVTSQTISVDILDDALVEGDETFPVTLSNPTGGAILGADNPASVLVVDDDVPPPGKIQLGSSSYSVSEGAGKLTVTVVRTATSTGSVAVDYATSDGSALAGADYTATGGTLVYAGGEVAKTFDVPVFNDAAVEGDETFTITLSNPQGGATLGTPASAPVTIVDDDVSAPGSLQLASPAYLVGEGGGSVTLTVTRNGGSTGSVTVSYASSDGTASAGSDYTTSSGTLSFGNGEVSKTIIVPILNDTTFEGNETFQVTLSSPTGGATLGSTAAATVTIVDNDSTIRFSSAGLSVSESAGTATITVLREGDTSGTSSVNYATSNGTATAGSDYTAANGTLTFGPGEVSKSFAVSITNDATPEANETINLALTGPTGGAVLGVPSTSTVTIFDDDIPAAGALQFSASAYGVREGAGTVTVTVSRTGGSSGSVSVQYATSNGTATAPADYGAASGTLTFAAGETSKTFNVSIVDDAIVESDETVNLALSSPTGGAVLGAGATSVLTITDNDVARPGTLQLSSAAYAAGEGGGAVTITVNRTGGSNGSVSVNYSTSDGTANAGSDYTAAGATLTFLDGEIVKTFNVTISQDAIVEGDETFNVTLASPTGGATLGTPSAALVTIVDDDTASAGTLSFGGSTYSVTEGTPTVTITVVRKGGTAGAVSAHYATSNGTATAGSDYTATSGTISFAAGEASKTFVIPILDDNLVESAETVNLTLSAATGGASIVAPSTATLTIFDNDVTSAGSLRFATSTYSAGEADGAATITVQRVNGSSGTVSVDYATSAGTTNPATAGADYTTTAGTLTFADGETSKSFAMPILADALVEGNETVTLTLSNVQGAASLLSPSTAVLTIVDDDVAVPGALQFSDATYNVSEAGASALITVNRTGGSAGSVSVHYTTSDGTATAGSDYVLAAATLTFNSGEVTKTFSVPLINDTLFEPAETVNLSLDTPLGGATLGAQSNAVMTIVDDDVAPVTVSAIVPNKGQKTGGTTVTISGTNFQAGASVTFGGVSAQSVTVTNSTTLTAVTPPHAVGPVDVVVTSGATNATLAGGFTYVNFDPNGDGLVTAADVVYLINYLMGGGAAPVNSGDADGDQLVNAKDVFYTINYIFAGGPAPV